MSNNEADVLKSVRYNLALLCPETDGLLPKHRITYKPEGTTVEEQRADIVIYAYDKFSSLLDGKEGIPVYLGYIMTNYLNCTADFEKNKDIRMFTTLLFWRFLCYCANIDFCTGEDKTEAVVRGMKKNK